MKKHSSDLLIRYKKAKGTLEAIILMIESGSYCVDIMQQNLAVIGLLKSAHQHLMADHLNSCFKTAMQTRNEEKQKKMISEILAVTHLLNK